MLKPNNTSRAYRPNITGNPSLGNIYTSRTDTGSNAGVMYNVNMFYFGNPQLYTRAEDAVDLTPSDKREFSYDVAGKWINKSGDKIYIGTPVFKFQSGDLSALCYACRNTSYKKENFILPIEGDDEHQNEIQRERTILADTFDGSGYLYEEIVETKKGGQERIIIFLVILFMRLDLINKKKMADTGKQLILQQRIKF